MIYLRKFWHVYGCETAKTTKIYATDRNIVSVGVSVDPEQKNITKKIFTVKSETARHPRTGVQNN